MSILQYHQPSIPSTAEVAACLNVCRGCRKVADIRAKVNLGSWILCLLATRNPNNVSKISHDMPWWIFTGEPILNYYRTISWTIIDEWLVLGRLIGSRPSMDHGPPAIYWAYPKQIAASALVNTRWFQIWGGSYGFLNIEVPPVIIHFDRSFQYKQPFWIPPFVSMYGSTNMCSYPSHLGWWTKDGCHVFLWLHTGSKRIKQVQLL